MNDAAYQRRWRAANHERLLVKERKWRAANRERLRANQRRYRAANLEKRRAKDREYRARDRERFARASLEYHWKNRERCLLYKRRYRQEHLERERERSRVHSRKRTGPSESSITWKLLNRDRIRENNRRLYQARKSGGLEAVFTKIEAIRTTGTGRTTMHNDKMIRFVKQWRELENSRRKLDFARSRWCREVRAEFVGGDHGDKAFINWLVVELGVAAVTGGELLERAHAIQVVPDETTWDRVGGFSSIRTLAHLKRPDQVAVLQAAKASAKTVRTVMRERGLISTAKVVTPDVVRLARFIAQLDHVPADVMEIVGRYVARKAIRRPALKAA